MPHPLVDQLRFARRQFGVALDGTPEEDGVRRLGPMNSIGWIVAHLAWHEQAYWLKRPQGLIVRPELEEHGVSGRPATTPPLAAMREAWEAVKAASNPWLDAQTPATLFEPAWDAPNARLVGNGILRVTDHYWFHTGEIMAIRQILGHPGLPEFIGDIDGLAPWRSEAE